MSETKNLFSAMIKANAEIQNLFPSSKGYGYNYIPLEKVIDEVKPIYAKYELSILQFPISNENQIGIENVIIHSSGESISKRITVDHIQMKGANQIQADGAVFTYLRRYSMTSICGIAGDEDTDCHGEQEKTTKILKNVSQNMPPKQTVNFSERADLERMKNEILEAGRPFTKEMNEEEIKFFVNIKNTVNYTKDQYTADKKKVFEIIDKYEKVDKIISGDDILTPDSDVIPEFLTEDEQKDDELPLGVE